MIFKFLLVVSLSSCVRSAYVGANYGLYGPSMRCRSFTKAYPDVDLGLPSFGSWCGVKLWGADGFAGTCDKWGHWAESCCYRMFARQLNLETDAGYNFYLNLTKGYANVHQDQSIGQRICSRLSQAQPEATSISTEIVLSFQYSCAAYDKVGDEQFPKWVTPYDNITASYDILEKNYVHANICCRDGVYQDKC